ncbi:putative signal transducing protein [Luteimonas gilva]|nr:DUF2007 domain-containing protein [Luteimonas gilva]
MLVTVAHYHDPIEAHIARGLLASQGIDAHLGDEHLALANWEWRLAVGGVKLRVPQEQAMRARDILHAAESGEYVLDDDDAHQRTADERVLQAPDRESWSSRIAWVALMLFSVPLPWRRKPIADEQAVREL